MEYNSEAIPKMIERLRTEHRDFRLIEIEETSKFTSHKAIEKLEEIGRLIARPKLKKKQELSKLLRKK